MVAQALAELRAGDPLRSVTLLVPSDLAGVCLRRRLARGVAGRRGVAGVEITTLGRLAERLALSAMGARRPLTTAILTAAWQRALTKEPGVFKPVADQPATAGAMVRAHRELRDLTPDAIQAVAASNPVSGSLVTLFNRVVDATNGRFYDSTDLLIAAARQPFDLGLVIDYLPQRRTRAERGFIDAVALRNKMVTVDDAHQNPASAAEPDRVTNPWQPTGGRIIAASDSDDEVRVVIRDLVTRLSDTRADRVGVLYSVRSPYGQLLHEQLTAAQLRFNGPGVRSVAERGVVRALLGLLDWPSHDYGRRHLFQAMSEAPILDFNGRQVPVASWERISRTAGIAGGTDWETRIQLLLADRSSRIETARVDDPESARIAVLQREVEQTNSLRSFASQLRSRLDEAAGCQNWAALADNLRVLIDDLVGAPGNLPSAESYALAALRSHVSQLSAIDGIGESPTLASALRLLDTGLQESPPRVGRFGEGVFVGPISAAVGLDLDLVYTVGLSENLYPARPPADGLLPDAARQSSGGELRPLLDRIESQHRELPYAWDSGASIVSFPRGDLRRSTQNLPSRFLLPTLRRLSGSDDFAAGDWGKQSVPNTVNSASFAAGLLNQPPATDQEWQTTAAPKMWSDPVLAASRSLVDGRDGAGLTRWDGNLIRRAGIPTLIDAEHPVSPTALEEYARCPFSYFVSRLLRVAPIEDPENIVTISAAEIGSIVHDAVDTLVREHHDELPGYGQPWSAEQRQQARAYALSRADDAEKRGLTGHPRLWAAEKARILQALDDLFDDDNDRRDNLDSKVVASELAFGLEGHPPISVELTHGSILLSGKADRVDRSRDGRVQVIDFKTGSKEHFKVVGETNPTGNGSKLQLPAYGLAAARAMGTPAEGVRASYRFVLRERGEVSLNLDADLLAEYRRVLGILSTAAGSGVFTQRPPRIDDHGYVQCPSCNPDGIGYQAIRQRWQRKRSASELSELIDLVEPDRRGP